MIVVLDTNVLSRRLCLRLGRPRRCFTLFAMRKVGLAVTKDILIEYETAAEEIARKPGKCNGVRWQPLFNWIRDKATYFEPAPLGKQRSRDADDDIFLACAIASDAKVIVSHDNDLLKLGNPFGVEIIKPSVFVARFK